MPLMRHVLTVIAAPASSAADSPGLNEPLVAALRAALAEAGAAAGEPDWLAPGTACDLPFDAPGREAAGTAEAAVRARLTTAPVDLAVQPAAARRRRLLVADMESTIIGQEMVDELAEAANLGPQIAEITARSMAGELDFAASLRERVRLLAGQPAEILERVAERITLNPGARTLVRTMRANGAYTALVSGGFDCFAGTVRDACGFHEARANRLLIGDGRLAGAVAEPILDRAAKRAAVEELTVRRGLAPQDSCAVGDGANDIEMIRAAGLGVAYRGKAVLRAAAAVAIDHGDLTALLYLQGYRRAEFLD